MFSSLKKKPLLSTRSFVASALFALVGVYELVIGVVSFFDGDIVGGIGYTVIALILAYLAVSHYRDAREVRGMSKDEALIAAALFDSIRRNGPNGPVRIVSVHSGAEDGDEDEATAEVGPTRHSLTSGSLQELRQARKGSNAAD